jgi:hypothetical protein
MTDRLGTSLTPTLSELLTTLMNKISEGLFVAMPGSIEKYDATKQVADVKPLIQLPVLYDDGSEGLDTLPVIPCVPVFFMRGGGYYVSFPLQKGDAVLLLFCDRALDTFMDSTGSVAVDPKHLRAHDLSDAIAIPGFYSTPKAIKDSIGSDFCIAKEGGAYIKIHATGQIDLNGNFTVDK